MHSLRQVLVAFAILLSSPAVWAETHPHLWSKRFGNSEDQCGQSVAVDASGNIIVTGHFEGTVDFGCGPLTSEGGYDIFVVKYDSGGNCIWSKSYGDLENQYVRGVAVDASGNIVFAGYFYGTVCFGGEDLTSAGNYDICVAEVDSGGNHVWSKSFGDLENQYGQSVAVDASGNVIVTGHFEGTVDFGGGFLTSAGDLDIFLAKFNSSGEYIWSCSFGNSSIQHANSIAVDASENIVVAGEFQGTVDFGCGALSSNGSYDILVAKYDSGGNCIWSDYYGNGLAQYAECITVDASGNVVVTGYFYGTVCFGGEVLTSAGNYDIYAAEFDSGGNHMWSRCFGDGNYQWAYGVAVDGWGNVVVTGDFNDTVDFGGGTLISAGMYDIYVAEFDSGGNHIWSRRFGDGFDQYARGVAVDASGNIVVVGHFDGQVDFGGGVLTSAGPWDVYVVKFGPMPPLVPSRGEWRYTFEEPDSGWTALEFNDSSWSTGHAPFGNTPHKKFGCTGPSWCTYWPPYDTLWIRKKFVVSELRDWYLYYGVDNEAMFYLNGDSAGIAITDQFPNDWSSIPLSASLFDVGENVVAVHLRDTDPYGLTAFDMFIGMDVVVSIDDTPNKTTPSSTRLYPNYPNPFNPVTTITYSIAKTRFVSLKIYDVLGRLIRILVEEKKEKGRYEVVWDGRDEKGREVVSGIYFYQLTAGEFKDTKKLALLR